MIQKNTKIDSHFWEEEYFNGRDKDTECTRVIYQGHPFHIVTIEETIEEATYVVTDNVCACLNLDTYTSIACLNQIEATCKTTKLLRKSNGKEYEVALLSEQGLCTLVGILNNPEAYDFLHDVQNMIRRINAPATGAYARIAERFAVAKRKRIEADPDSLLASANQDSHPLSAPAYYSRLLLKKEEVQPASVLTLDASLSLQIYQDAQGSFWFDSRCIIKATGHSAVADPAMVFADVPSCWLADLTIETADGKEQVIPCILLQGILFYLSASTNLTLIYLMYYIALQVSLLTNDQEENSSLIDRPVPVACSDHFGDVPVRYTIDADNQVWYVLADITASYPDLDDSSLLANVPDAFQSFKTFKEDANTGGEGTLKSCLCLTEQGLWFLLAKCQHTPEVKDLITSLSKNPPKYEDRLNLYRSLTKWAWPYITDPSTIPSYSQQLQGLEVVLSATKLAGVPEWSVWGLDAVAEATTGISPLAIIKRWQRNNSVKDVPQE